MQGESPSPSIPSFVSADQERQFIEEGYFILENGLSPADLDLLRDDVDAAIADVHARMDKAGTDTLGISHRNKRYFAPHRYRGTADFVFGPLMQDICRKTIGDTAYFFLDQHVVKAAETGLPFGWHQDSGYLEDPYHEPYVTCWTPLDDVSEENGTVFLLPYSHCGVRTWVRHIVQPGSNDKVGYFGSEPGIPVNIPAGSVAVFSSLVFHRSGQNRTDRMRRVYLTQYSPEIIINKETGKPRIKGIPFLENGQCVTRRDDL